MAINLLDISPGLIFQADGFQVSAFPVDHRGSNSLGFRFEEMARRPFLPEKAAALGIPPGPWRQDLVEGNPATLPDGRLIDPNDVLGEERPGTCLVVVGDVGRPEKLLDFVRGADTLVIEATYLKEEAHLAAEFGHSTAEDVARLASEAGVGQLVMTHVSRRYKDESVNVEAQAIFPNAILARDFDVFQVKH